MREIKVTDMRVIPGDASFMVDDGVTAVLVDTGFGFTGPALVEKVKAYLGDRNLEYILMTHSHYDHVLGMPCMQDAYPDAKIIGARHAANVFEIDETIEIMRDMDTNQARLNGVEEYDFAAERLKVDIIVEDGDIVECGTMKFEAVHLPGHTRCSFGFYEPDHKFLIAAETIGHSDGGWNVMPATWLVGIQMGFDSIDKILKYDIKTMLAPHAGHLNEEQTANFLSKTRGLNEESIAYLKESISAGMTNDEIMDGFKARFRQHAKKDVAPVKAINLNLFHMINVIKREFSL